MTLTQRHTAKRIFDRLCAEHDFTGGYTIIKDYVRERDPPRPHPRDEALCRGVNALGRVWHSESYQRRQ